ncbi:Actin cytoskeleton-regulatory complex protein [Actinidia chinensis var. chinensis]|uniref:Actin cytoskeleton-regulatory complex protein n=1 Tax=Actinidia chinensis var. chinensis TaxID=1590841 RepID=A0A2R6P669_ACTCC|nr:Actin cytoskeleton-regulatory complex protein [Actinidia chinensis var. chinensis]
MKMAMILFLAFSLFLQGALGDIVCEELPVGMCSFSIDSSGHRCLLETYSSTIRSNSEAKVGYQCKTSEVGVKDLPEWVESDECIRACGVDRYSVGISSDSLLESQFTSKLCAPACYQNCPNIVDLYYNLALGEGAFLPGLCKAQQSNPRRVMAQVLSSGAASGLVSATANGPAATAEAAPGPASGDLPSFLACAPASV